MRFLRLMAALGLALAMLAGGAAAAPGVVTNCGAPISSITKTMTNTFTFNLEQYVSVPGAGFIVRVPQGETRCLRVRFFASAYCPLSCFPRVMDGTTTFEPSFVASLRFASGNDAEAHAFEWVKRVGPGTHQIRVQIATGNTSQNAELRVYSTTLEVTR
jgi:hypothetical protein